VVALNLQIHDPAKYCSFRTVSKWLSIEHCMTAKLSGSYSWSSFFRTDIFQLFRFVASHSLKTLKPSFCALRGVLVLVFASQVGKLLFGQRRKFFICSDIAEKVMRNGKIWHISMAKLRYSQLQTMTSTLTLCLVDATLCADRLVAITDCIFWEFIGSDKLSYILLIDSLPI